MTTDTEVKPIIQPLTDDEAGNVAVLGARTPRESEALFALANGWHGTYDKATHAAVEHAELERLRVVDRAVWRVIASLESGSALKSMAESINDERTAADLRSAIEAARKEHQS